MYGDGPLAESDWDLTSQHDGEPQGQRIVVSGRVLDGGGRPVPDALIELWQANAGGRYIHERDEHPAPLDPNFTGAGRCLTDADGRYRFVTIKPGAYPWRNHPNAWRPAHIHFSLFGRAFTDRLVTQMYFPGDPLFPFDPIFQSIRDERAARRLISAFDWETTTPEWALGYRFDIVLGGRDRDADGGMSGGRGDAVTDRGAVLLVRPVPARAARAGRSRPRGCDPRRRLSCWTAAMSR